MLTPAEEMGLSGLSLASRVRKAFYNLPETEVIALTRRIHEESTRRHLIYLRDGELETIHVLPCPITVLPDQLSRYGINAADVMQVVEALGGTQVSEVLGNIPMDQLKPIDIERPPTS